MNVELLRSAAERVALKREIAGRLRALPVVDRAAILADLLVALVHNRDEEPTDATPPEPIRCLRCRTPITYSDRLIAALRQAPRAPIADLAGELYGTATPANGARVRALLSQLARFGKVRRVGAGAWEACGVGPRAPEAAE